MGGNLKEGGKEGLQEGAYSLYPREINIYFLRGVLYIYSTERVAKERDTANKKRERARKHEETGAKRSICEVFGDIVRLWQLPFSGKFKGSLNISVGGCWASAVAVSILCISSSGLGNSCWLLRLAGGD